MKTGRMGSYERPEHNKAGRVRIFMELLQRNEQNPKKPLFTVLGYRRRIMIPVQKYQKKESVCAHGIDRLPHE